jgi:hypothetical protein
MLKLFYFYPGQEDHIVNVGVQQSHYTGKGIGSNFNHGVKWKYESLEYSNWLSKSFHCEKKMKKKTIELFEEMVTIMAYPSPDYKYIVASYIGISQKFPMPNNAVIYNLDGSINKILTPPILINEYWHTSSIRGECFFNMGWDIKDGKVFLCFHIAVGFDWVEVRELNAETGEFSNDWSRVYKM